MTAKLLKELSMRLPIQRPALVLCCCALLALGAFNAQ